MKLLKQEETTEDSTASGISSQLFGSAAGSTAGFAIGDPTGITAAALSIITNWGLDKYILPLLISKRQSERLYLWGQQAAEGIVQRLESGEKYREDGFFEKDFTNRSSADEVVESTLQTVIDTTEEPKIKYMSNLTENVHFDPDFDLNMYRRFLNILDELSYRQLCVIKLFMNAEQIDLELIGNPTITPKLSSILSDILEVQSRKFIDGSNPLMKKIRELYSGEGASTWVISGKPAKYSGFSENLCDTLFKFAKLDQIPDGDVDAILRELKNDR